MNQSVEGLGGHPKMLWLKLSLNQFGMIPPSLLSLTSLQYLDMSFNRLVTIPPQISSVCFQYFPCSGSPSSLLGPQILQLVNLRVLSLQNNQIISLPTQMGHLTNLEELLVADNKMDFLPVEVSIKRREGGWE